MGGKEKKFLVAFIILCILLPFGMIKSPLEIITHVFPLWGSYYGFVSWWAYTGKPLWQAFLASYGIASIGIIMLYFGIGVIQNVFSWIKKHFWIDGKKKTTKKEKNNKSGRLARWLSKGSIWFILFVLFLPFPGSDPIATMAMKIKGVRYGLWYLLAVNILHIYLIVWGTYQGIEFFPSIVEFFKRLFM